MTGSSTQGIKTVLHPVSDLETATKVYTALLGVPPHRPGVEAPADREDLTGSLDGAAVQAGL